VPVKYRVKVVKYYTASAKNLSLISGHSGWQKYTRFSLSNWKLREGKSGTDILPWQLLIIIENLVLQPISTNITNYSWLLPLLQLLPM
jgi:hypothetical protein